MTTKYSSIESLQQAIIAETHKWYELGIQLFPQERKELVVEFVPFRNFGDKAGCAGTCGIHQTGKHVISYNLELSWNNQEDMLSQTVPHEVAHVIADFFFKPVRPHGCEHSDMWAIVMLKFGKPADRYHDYNVKKDSTRLPADEF